MLPTRNTGASIQRLGKFLMRKTLMMLSGMWCCATCRWKLRLLVVSAAWLLLFLHVASGQQAPVVPELSIRATTRLVTVDTIVTGADSRPVSGLTKEDFTILEDGKPQKIAFFSYVAAQQKPAAPPPRLRPDVFTNRPEYHSANGPLVIILLDGLNTPPTQQLYVHQQIMKYLASLKLSGPGTAILALGNTLTVLQDFTTDPQLLLSAAKGYKEGRTAVDIESPKIEIPITTGPGGGAPAQAKLPSSTANDDAANIASQTKPGNGFAQLAESLNRFDREVAANNEDVRVRVTLDALRRIAHAVSGYPGRKSLIWFSAGFPISLALDQSTDLDLYRPYHEQIRQTSARLSDANVAVYPIDARGLITSPLADPGSITAPSQSLGSGFSSEFSRKATMNRLADDTGGKVFYQTNDLNGALQVALNDAQSYYWLSYYPERKKWDGKFRTIKIVMTDRSLKVRHRTGYYAVDPGSWRKAGDEKLISLSDLHALSNTGVLFYAHPVLPEKKGQDITVELLIDAHSVNLESGAAYSTDLDFQIGAFSSDGKLAHLESQTAKADELRPETYQQFLRSGIPVRFQLALKPGSYVLHVGVRDNTNGHIGSLEMPLQVQK
jgi:VWFA-related protein